MKTIKIKIAVAVWPDGAWNSCGWSGGTDAEKTSIAVEAGPTGERLSWVEANVPLPELETITGTVTPSDK